MFCGLRNPAKFSMYTVIDVGFNRRRLHALVGCLRLCHCLIVVISIIFVLVSVTTYRVLSLVIDVDVELSMLLSLLLLFIIVKVLFSSSLLSSR